MNPPFEHVMDFLLSTPCCVIRWGGGSAGGATAGGGGGGSKVVRNPSAIKQMLLDWCKAMTAEYEVSKSFLALQHAAVWVALVAVPEQV